jgi:hypothetical protein
MGYKSEKIDSVKAIHIPTRIKKNEMKDISISDEEFNDLMLFKKADAQIRIIIAIGNILKIESLSLKKANSEADYNQVDKRLVDTYQKMWNFDDEITYWLKLFTGENTPNLISNIKLRDERRLFLDEMPENIRNKIVNFFDKNKIIVVSDILKGRGGLSANWMLVTRYNKTEDTTAWILKDINTVMNFFGMGEIIISPKGSFLVFFGNFIILKRQVDIPWCSLVTS